MPPFNASHPYLAQNATFNISVPTNATCPSDAPAHGVSWQSAYWSVMACSLAVLLQETGKVVNAPYRISYALRASPLICAIDTFLMLLKFMVMLAVGCSPRMAVRHVWYDRFVEDEDIGDRSWVVWVWRDFSRKHRLSSTTGNDPSCVGVPQNDGPTFDGEAQGTSSGAPPGSDNGEIRLADVQHLNTTPAIDTVEPTPIPSRKDDLDSTDAELGCSRALPVMSKEGSDIVSLPANYPPGSSAILIRRSSQPGTGVTSSVTQTEAIATQEPDQPDGKDVAPTSGSVSIVHQEQSPNNATDEAPTTVGQSLDRPSPSEVSITYMTDLPGCAVDRSWRLSMVSFIFGALPQAVKVFAMKGIPVTQIVVAFLISSFITSEVFRSVAGPVGLSNLYHPPVVLRCKRILSSTHLTHLAFIACYSYLILLSCVMVFLEVPGPAGSVRNGVFAYSFIPCFAVASWLSNRMVDLLEYYVFSKTFAAYIKSRSLHVSHCKLFDGLRGKLLLLVPRSLMLGPSRVESHAVWLVVFPGFFAGIVWVYWRFSSLIVTLGWGTATIFIGPTFIITPAYMLVLSHVLYHVIFANSLADPLRYICGVKGTLDEFATGIFLLLNVGLTLFMYSVTSGFNDNLTFKPSWTEMLG
ncbi:hypothetical protein BKA58DRAFT_220146 [Alternaria rosae]|uniref:uncharacterized protein n=1 Tax=Alternaria rosae TaxID=1187941 RepID=UPI001E8E9378|nr:uncharacterized protein BKA58DRAFT_220146 [Alternaria rosae]KAH6865371.1 hypothetical protein BKA58DRAFT_220146 [Alternaria rosae]